MAGNGQDAQGLTTAELSRAGTSTESLRARAAWMYYVEQHTQNDIATRLGIGRVTVVRLLADARARDEVRITLSGRLDDAVRLERALEDAFALERAVVAPVSVPDADPVPAISAATGAFLSDIVKPGMRIGAGWGRTLYGSLPFIHGRTLEDLRVISLLGGIIEARRFNPAEFAWRLAEVFQGEGFLIPAPAIVDSTRTRDALIRDCGIDSIFDMAERLDMALLSVGALQTGTSRRVGYLGDEEHRSLVAAGAVGDLLFHFIDRDGRVVDHEINERVVSIGPDALRRVPVRIMSSGGHQKIDALLGVMRLVAPTVLVTDEHTARALLLRADEPVAEDRPA